jgi:hypothetical protein
LIAETLENVGGVLTFLWHLNHIIKDDWWNQYLRILKYPKAKNTWFESVKKIGGNPVPPKGHTNGR